MSIIAEKALFVLTVVSVVFGVIYLCYRHEYYWSEEVAEGVVLEAYGVSVTVHEHAFGEAHCYSKSAVTDKTIFTLINNTDQLKKINVHFDAIGCMKWNSYIIELKPRERRPITMDPIMGMTHWHCMFWHDRTIP